MPSLFSEARFLGASSMISKLSSMASLQLPFRAAWMALLSSGVMSG